MQQPSAPMRSGTAARTCAVVAAFFFAAVFRVAPFFLRAALNIRLLAAAFFPREPLFDGLFIEAPLKNEPSNVKLLKHQQIAITPKLQ
ncbi:hypothetical protein [Bradyrhizobium sp. SEMIA]|uniref:hypothetical protein n=1 Tax=Bradyrhizobium sp. SEMIA TaxID=2597515 RepID=UPI0018A5DA93|nr:hypothetical protein [Bradyrhizobium sp. SEMIA]QOG21774.1 hypothetical protein FOM02_35265 [Bradyrhizobium sp. SEMIA]